ERDREAAAARLRGADARLLAAAVAGGVGGAVGNLPPAASLEQDAAPQALAPGRFRPIGDCQAHRPVLSEGKAARAAPCRKGACAPMIKASLRLVSMVLLAAAVIMAVLDATRSIAAGVIVMTPLGSSWAALSRQSLAGFEALVTENLPGFVWDPVLLWLF